MKRPLALLATLVAVLAAPSASGASVASVVGTQSFHLPSSTVGCHVTLYGPVSAGLASSAKIRCESYALHTFATLQNGTLTKTHSGSRVSPGTVTHRNGWFHRFSPKSGCSVLMYFDKPAFSCWSGSKSFTIGPTAVATYS